MYLQQVVDVSVRWEQDAASWGPTYSGDTLDCQAVRDLHAKHQMKTNLSNTKQGEIYLIYSVSSDSHSMYTFDYACKFKLLCQQFSLSYRLFCSLGHVHAGTQPAAGVQNEDGASVPYQVQREGLKAQEPEPPLALCESTTRPTDHRRRYPWADRHIPAVPRQRLPGAGPLRVAAGEGLQLQLRE